MIAFFRRHLGARLFLSYLAVILAGGIVLGLTTRFSVPEAFYRHMGAAMGQGMMGNGPGGGPQMMSSLFQNFQAGFYEALFLALTIAAIVAILVSLLLSRSLLAPVRALTTASRELAEGRYSERVGHAGEDELGQLAGSFNRMAEKLEQVESMRRQLIADVSHELRTPLTAIKGSMEGLMDGVLPATEATFQQIHQEADRLARLVDDLQELSRVEAGAYTLQPEPTDLPVLIQTTLKRLSPQANAKHITLGTILDDDLPPVRADAARLAQVLTNLVANAIQYTPAGGDVSISADRHGGEVAVHVSDTGIGIPPEHLLHLFTRFYRVDKSRSRQSGGGSGIGLAIARHLVEAQGGRIWAESAGEGKGSRFSFTLPMAQDGDR